MYTNCQFKQENRYIDVYNTSSDIMPVRYLGVYHTPDTAVPYRTMHFISGEHFLFTFPNNATNASMTIQVYNVTAGGWQDIFTTVVSFPGAYCYRVSGTLASPQVNQTPCSSQNNLTNNICCNNVVPSIC